MFFVFRDPYVLCIYVMNIRCTFHISVSWVCYILMIFKQMYLTHKWDPNWYDYSGLATKVMSTHFSKVKFNHWMQFCVISGTSETLPEKWKALRNGKVTVKLIFVGVLGMVPKIGRTGNLRKTWPHKFRKTSGMLRKV